MDRVHNIFHAMVLTGDVWVFFEYLFMHHSHINLSLLEYLSALSLGVLMIGLKFALVPHITLLLNQCLQQQQRSNQGDNDKTLLSNAPNSDSGSTVEEQNDKEVKIKPMETICAREMLIGIVTGVLVVMYEVVPLLYVHNILYAYSDCELLTRFLRLFSSFMMALSLWFLFALYRCVCSLVVWVLWHRKNMIKQKSLLCTVCLNVPQSTGLVVYTVSFLLWGLMHWYNWTSARETSVYRMECVYESTLDMIGFVNVNGM